jgi:aspartate/methionine/tyrosine aminotransferase
MDAYDPTATYQLAETCCSSISVAELIQLSADKVTTASDIFDVNKKQTYGEIHGLVALRENIAEIYAAEAAERIGAEDILITPGAIAANTISALALVTKGDHVICQFPTYQQLYSVPQFAGADVDFWECKETNGWLPDLDDLLAKITPKTKLIVLKYVFIRKKVS